ncbi:YcaO-like family protein [Phaeobacter inhibens]|uniref:YcaO-like family protein n=1 Tax=Phaeobacter inhibens TaxID=221822 RepID=UPI0012E345F6|nr:YcaO-like family protein [Phaeobacter inhibens]WHP67298.1 YcaO-like family protein [Phaeobacter inhibens]
MTSADLVERIAAAEQAGLISPASMADFPLGSPLSVAFRLVTPRRGTLPPSLNVSRRYASGAGLSIDAAKMLSGLEAIERYSIQFSSELPDQIDSVWSSDRSCRRVEVDALALGSPRVTKEVQSIGAAAGRSIEDASSRAVMELAEYTLRSRSKLELKRISDKIVDESSIVGRIREWLGMQARCIEFAVCTDLPKGCFVRCSCHDESFYRPTFGTAFSLDISEAIQKSCFEAVTSWRNMVSLEFNGINLSDVSEEEERVLRTYREKISPLSSITETISELPGRKEKTREVLSYVASCLTDFTGKSVHVFDMSAPEIGLPVVKAIQLE